MKSTGKPAVRAVLRDFSEGRVHHSTVARALVEHDDWIVPLETMVRYYGRLESAITYAVGEVTALPDGTLWVFTDLEAALSAQAYGYVPGSCAGGISGSALFRELPTSWKEVVVNVGSPVENSWYQQPHETRGYGAMTAIAKAVPLERTLAGYRPQQHAEFMELVRCHDSWWLVGLRDRTFLSAYSAGEGPPFLSAFTAPDRVDAAIRALNNPGLFEGAHVSVVNGTRLIDIGAALAVDGYRGLMINGPEDGLVFPLAVR
jgi:hypothetical protein